MAKETLLTYLDEQIEKKLADFDVAIDWDTRNHTIEVIVRLYAENTNHMAIDDQEGVRSEEEIIEFEDAILLYDDQKAVFDEDDYLAVIPFAGKKGMQQKVIDALITYLPEILVKGQDDLLDFLVSDEESVFELHFSPDYFQALQADMMTAKQERFLPYPSY